MVVPSTVFLEKCTRYLLILVLCQNYSVEVAANEVAKDDTAVYAQHLPCMCLKEGNWYAKVIECVGYAVGEAAYDEERNRKQKRKIMLFTGKSY